ncbi:MAG: Hemolysin C [Proteobacteria bacterium]|nr:MAG: Hemolysin C [Pseudomonadota bacterium]|tara:strand:+ start:731 stop:1585 length:855 start_codon:yes stop_codon:yes gene_type:complete
MKLFDLFTKRNKADEDLSKILEENREDSSDKPLTEQEKELLSSAVRFHDLQADEVCVPNSELAYVDIKDDFDTIIEKFKETRFNKLLVVNENIDSLIGVVSLSDMLDYIDNKDNFALKHIIKHCTFVPENLNLPKVISQMKNNRHQIAVVVDEYGGTSGVITVKDILSEFVGDMDEEEDELNDLIKPIKKNSYLVDPRLEIDILEEKVPSFSYSVKEEEDDFETLAGLIFQLVRRIPEVGEEIEVSDKWKIKILDVDPRKINKVELIKLEQDHQEEQSTENQEQ